MPLSERRHFPRFPFHSRGMLNLFGGHYPGTVLDISFNGALFRSADRLGAVAGNHCNLLLLRSGEADFPVATARVAYHRNHLLGLEFVEMTDDARHFLGEIMDMNLAVDSLLERQLPQMLGLSAE